MKWIGSFLLFGDKGAKLPRLLEQIVGRLRQFVDRQHEQPGGSKSIDHNRRKRSVTKVTIGRIAGRIRKQRQRKFFSRRRWPLVIDLLANREVFGLSFPRIVLHRKLLCSGKT